MFQLDVFALTDLEQQEPAREREPASHGAPSDGIIHRAQDCDMELLTEQLTS